MLKITSTTEASDRLKCCLENYKQHGVHSLAECLYQDILSAKVKFPLLEKLARQLYRGVSAEDFPEILRLIAAQKTIGGNVFIGILLQGNLSFSVKTSFKEAAYYIDQGAEWYVSDIIGERVFGYALLNYPEALYELRELKTHPSRWVVRAIGPGIHYAVKKGLSKELSDKVFRLLLTMGNVKDAQIKKGIGWPVKTIARFHPDLIGAYSEQIRGTGRWFQTKVKLGLNYAERDQRKNRTQ